MHVPAVQGANRRHGLREQPGLDLPGDVELVREAPVGLGAFGQPATLGVDFAADDVHADQRKRVSVDVFEDGDRATPWLDARRITKAYAPLRPVLERARQVVGDERHTGRPPEHGIRLVTALVGQQRDHRVAVWRRDGQPAKLLVQRVDDQTEPERVQVEDAAPVLVAHEDGHTVHAQVRCCRRRLT